MAKNIRIFSPLDGKLIPLKECTYPIFSSGAIGHGIAIKNPTYGIFAPFSGVVTLFFPIRHAISLKSNDGIEIFIHIGIEDNELNCEEFKSEVKVGETVKPGQLLLKFSPSAIKKATLNNLSKEKGKMEETKFTILGESLSGKTCCLLAMYSAMSEGINGYSIVAQDDRLDTELLESFEKLDDDSISNERFPGVTDQAVTYLFNLNYAQKPIMPFKWEEAFSPLFVAKNIRIGVIPVTLGENISDDDYSGEVDPVNIHLPIFMGIFFALNEKIAAYKYKLESNNRSINDMDYWRRDEQDSFFIWRDDDKIRRLSAQISNTQKENERIQQLIQNMEQNKNKFLEYLNQIMWFIDGSWRI